MAKCFPPKAVEAIQNTLGLTLTQEQIDHGCVEFPIKSHWPWKTDPATATISRNWYDGEYTVWVEVNPAPCPAYTDFIKRAKAVPQLAKACALLKNY